MSRVALFALSNIRNVGEDLLADTTEWLIRRALPDCEVQRVQFCPQGRGEDMVQRMINRIARCFLRMSERTSGTWSYRWLDLYYRIRHHRRFRRAIARADAVVSAVGMFKFASQDFSYLYALVARIASRCGVPFMISAPSVAEADPGEWRSAQLARTLSSGGVARFTTRDGAAGVERIRRGYGAPERLPVSAVGDPALWIPECYGITACPSSERTLVGVNLVRGGIYETYRGGVSEEGLLTAYHDLLAALDARGYEWRLFSNGTKSDERFGDLLCSRFRIPAERRLPPTRSPADYVRRVASFRLVFAARFHAFLSATALGIPSVALDWDDKFVFTARELGRERFLVDLGLMNGAEIVARLEESERTPLDAGRLNVLKAATESALRDFILECCKRSPA